jgi:hypothetical protein
LAPSTWEHIPFCPLPCPSGAFFLSRIVRVAVNRPPQVLNTCNGRLLHQFSQTPPGPGGLGIEFPTAPTRATRSGQAAPLSAPTCWQTTVSSDDPPPRATNNTGHVSPVARRSSPAAAASWSMTNHRSSWAAPAAATSSPGCRRSRSATGAPRWTGRRIIRSDSVRVWRPLAGIMKQTPSAERTHVLPEPRSTAGDGSRLTASRFSACACGERNPRFLARRFQRHTSASAPDFAESQLLSEIRLTKRGARCAIQANSCISDLSSPLFAHRRA